VSDRIEIAGAGPAGLAAALTIARGGGRALVSERRDDVGKRFHGDFQGIENWTTAGDVLDEFASIGIEPTFTHTPFRECRFYDPAGRAYTYSSDQPIWYLVRRGTDPDSLDQSLKTQALAAGVDLELGTERSHLARGGIVAHGPRRRDAIAVGYVFETDHKDGAFAAISDDLAPKGYSYLLICGGRGTIASCMSADFHNEAVYLKRTVAFFEDRVRLDMRNATKFGGFGNVFPTTVARKARMVYVGEAAGFQDAFFGFGMRYAVLSGHLAGRALLNGGPEAYDGLWQDRLGGLLKVAAVNRYFYEKLGNNGYMRLMRSIAGSRDVRDWLRRYYTNGSIKSLLYPIARRRFASKRDLVVDCIDGCDCTWCRCNRHGRSMEESSV
jgi:flavin-dependent dehydrogenase